MYKKLFFLITLFLLFNVNAFPQARILDYDLYFSVFWDFYSENNIGARVWGMGGAGVANVNDLTAMVINPAAFDFENRSQFYFEVLNKSKSRWLLDMYLKSPTILPDFIGFGSKINDRVNTGWGYSSPKYYKLDFGEIFLIVPGSPEPIDTIHPYDVFQSKQVIFLLNYKLKKGISIGGNLNYNFLSLDLRKHLYGHSFGDSDVNYLNFKFGVLAEIHRLLNFKEEDIKINLGIVYTPQKSFKTETKWKWEDFEEVVKFGKTVLPTQLEIGLKIYNLPFPINFAGDVKFSDNSKIRNLVDRWDIHLGCEWEPTENLAFQLGYFTRLDYRNSDHDWLDEVGEHDQHFLTSGIRVSFSQYIFQLSIRDSHLLSSGLIETTQISLGGGVNF